MRCNPLRWLWGLAPIALLAWFATDLEHAKIEADLKTRTIEALKAEGLGWAESGFSGRDGLVTGRAIEESEPGRAEAIVRKVWGVRIVDNKAGLIDKQDNYVWSASRRENRIKLSGFVPNEATRREIVGLVRASFPGHEVDDRLKLARGAPSHDVWFGGVAFGLKQLTRLKRGQVDLEQTALTLTGEATNGAEFRTVISALQSMPKGINLKMQRVTPPVVSPYTFSARLAGRELVLAGHVPSEEMRKNIRELAKQYMPRATVVDRMELADGAVESWPGAMTVILRELGRLEEGAVDVKDNIVTFNGLAQKEETADLVRKTVRGGLPAIFKSTENVRFREPTIKTISPFVTSIDATGQAIALKGHVPSDALRLQLVNALRAHFPDRRIEDRLALGAGAPDGWLKCLEAGGQALKKVQDGQFELRDRSGVLTGLTAEEDIAEGLPGELKSTAGRNCDAAARLTFSPPPEPVLDWRARYDSIGKELVLLGDVPNDVTREELVRLAQRQFPKDIQIVNEMRVVGTSSRRWQKTALSGLRMLAGLRRGEARLTGLDLTLTGEAGDVTVQTAIKEQMARELAKPYSGRDVIEIRSDAMIVTEIEARRRAEAEAKRKADDEQRRLAELDRARAEEEQRRRGELERTRSEEEARRRAEEEQRRREEAARRAEEERRAAEAQKRAEEERRAKALADYAWTADYDGTTVVLKGQIPGMLARWRVVRGVQEALPKARVDDQMTVADPAPERWEDAVRLASSQLAGLARGSATIKGGRVHVTGEVEQRETVDRIRAALASPPQGFRGTEAVSYRAPAPKVVVPPTGPIQIDTCRDALKSIQREGVINFRRGSAELDEESLPTLAKLADVAKRCDKVRIEVSGHTDSDGNPQANQRLSQRRARAVADFLIDAGVTEGRLTAVGYGPDRPVAENDNPENKAKNRRIEFTVTAE